MPSNPIIVLLVASVVIVSVAGWASKGLRSAFVLWPYGVKRQKQFHRLLTAGWVHADPGHLFFNMLTLWFFATPIIYPMHIAPGISKQVLDLNPFAHLAVSYQEILFYDGPFGHWKWLLALLVASIGLFLLGYALFDRLRDSLAEGV